MSKANGEVKEISITKEETSKLMELWDNWTYYYSNPCEREVFHQAHVDYVNYLGEVRKNHGYVGWSVRRIDWDNGLMVIEEEYHSTIDTRLK